jgi:mannose-6-phosphate isomerase-like protein (cupin superfamily)
LTVKIVKVADVGKLELPRRVKSTARSLIGPKTTGSKNIQLFYTTIEVGGESLPHTHPCEAGHFILDGQLVLECEEGGFTVGSNTAIYISPKVQHRFVNRESKPSHMLVLFAPPEEAYEAG